MTKGSIIKRSDGLEVVIVRGGINIPKTIKLNMKKAHLSAIELFAEKIRVNLPEYFWPYPSSINGSFTNRDRLIDHLVGEEKASYEKEGK